MSVISWNCRGYRSNYRELKFMLNKINPNVVCLQETFHGNNRLMSPRDYTMITADPIIPHNPGVRPSRGVVTLIHNSTPSQEIELHTNLEATAVRVKLSHEVTICNIYVSPH